MAKIYKYGLNWSDWQTIEMPVDACFLSIQVQNGRTYLWAKVDADNANETRTIITKATGEEFDDTNLAYAGTYLNTDTGIVGHVFEELYKG